MKEEIPIVVSSKEEKRQPQPNAISGLSREVGTLSRIIEKYSSRLEHLVQQVSQLDHSVPSKHIKTKEYDFEDNREWTDR